MPLSNHSIHKTKEIGSQSTKGVMSWDARGLVPKMQGDGFATEPGGIMEVAMWLCVPLLLGLWLYFGFSTQLCCVGSRQSCVHFRQ